MADTRVEVEEPRQLPPKLEYQPALDGVRALAVLAVLLYHDALFSKRQGWARGGFLGVDAFFVLSGFLITSLLVIERGRAGRIDFKAFWSRRARRLLPALLVMLLGVAAYAAFVAKPSELYDIRGQGIATLFYAQNWFVIASHPATVSPLGHAWSLAIEEQWYFIWPPLLGVLLWWTRGRLGRVLAIVLALALGSALEMRFLYVPGTAVSRIYRGTDTRAQALLIGAALALLLLWRGNPRRLVAQFCVEVAGILAGLYFCWLIVQSAGPHWFLYRGGFFTAALAAALVILAAVQPESVIVRPLLALPPLRWLGLISYGVYLYHVPIDVWLSPARVGFSGVELLVVRILVTLSVATASYHFVEVPVRRGAPRGIRGRVLFPVAALVVCGVLILATTGAKSSRPTNRSDSTAGRAVSPIRATPRRARSTG